jgi:hypothetical protein
MKKFSEIASPSANSKVEPKSKVEIRLALDFDSYNSKDKRLLHFALAAFLDVSPDSIQILAVERGSVKVSVGLSREHTAALMQAVEGNNPELFKYLDPLFVIEVTLKSEPASKGEKPQIATQPAKSERPRRATHGKSVKLYVGNLSFNTTEVDLQNLFAQAGAVQEVTLMQDKFTGKSRGFAFVTMTSDADAQKAITEFNGRTVEGHPLTVNEVRPREERRGFSGGYGGRSEKGRPDHGVSGD